MNEMKNNFFDIIIIGGGSAGIFAATTGSYFGYKCCLLERNSFLGGQVIQLYPNKNVYDFPTKIKVKGKSIIDELVSQVKETDTEIILNANILEINEQDNIFSIKIKDKSECFYAKVLIIATGVGALMPNVLEINGKEFANDKVIYSIDENIEKFKDKKIVVLGGGDSAIDWANHLVNENISDNVSIIHRRHEFRGNYANVDKMKKNNISQFLGCEILSIDENFIKIINENGQENKIGYDFILVQYGQKNVPFSIDYFNKIERNEQNKIIVDQNQTTNIKNVYAVGDATFYKNKANTIVTAVAESTKVIWYIHKENKKNI
ncbi:MAG: NAD(P)/FAD-dependent oxidoreductase [Malacoplasma sp.]